MPTYVMTSFRDSIAFSSVILSGLSSDVCFFMSAASEEEETERKEFVGEQNRQGEMGIMERKVKECREQGGRYGWRRMRRRRHREGLNYTGSFCVKLFFHCWRSVCECVCVTVEEESHTRQPLHRSDEQVHKRLSAALRLGLVDLHNPSVTATDTMRHSVFLQDIFSLKLCGKVVLE